MSSGPNAAEIFDQAIDDHIEAVRQLRDDVPPERHVDAEFALAHSFGGPCEASNCTIIYERDK